MSTKTSIKRVAVIAAAALTIGGFSAVSAFAASTPGLAASTSTGANSVSASTTYPLDTVTVSATVGKYVLETVTAQNTDSVYNITLTGLGSISIANPSAGSYPALDSADSTGATSAYTVSGNTVQYFTGTAPGIGGNFNTATTRTITFAVYSATAGTSTLTVTGNGSGTAAVVQTITWGAAPAISVANSKSVYLASVGSSNQAKNLTSYAFGVDSTTALPNTASSLAGTIIVQLNNDAASPAGIQGDSLTALVTSGNALVNGTAGGDTGTALTGNFSISAASTTDAGGYAAFGVSSNGASGSATIEISYTSSAGVKTVIATKTVSFYSSTIASIAATVNIANVPASTNANYVYAGSVLDMPSQLTAATGFSSTLGVVPAVSVSAKDSNGNFIPSNSSTPSNILVTSSDKTVATVGTYAKYDSGLKTYYPVITAVAPGTTTLTFTDAATGAIAGTAVINVTKPVIAAVTTSTDASSYDPATLVKYTISATDSNGKPVPDGTYANFFASGYEPTSNIAMQGLTTIADTLTTVAGVQVSKWYAPVTPGVTVNIAAGTLNGTAGSAVAGNVAVAAALNGSSQGAATFTVNGGSDASAATDAANAATDAANAAADAADNATQAASEALAAVNSLATTVASLIAGIKAQITSLTNLITKIKNKVGA